MDCRHEGDGNLLRTYSVYPSQPDLAVGYNFGSCLKHWISLKRPLWYLFKLKLGPHWVVT